MSKSPPQTTEQWAADWLTPVAEGASTMSQRRLSSIEKHEGGLAVVKATAEKLGVHLLLVEDDQGNNIVAASNNPFQVIC